VTSLDVRAGPPQDDVTVDLECAGLDAAARDTDDPVRRLWLDPAEPESGHDLDDLEPVVGCLG